MLNCAKKSRFPVPLSIESVTAKVILRKVKFKQSLIYFTLNHPWLFFLQKKCPKRHGTKTGGTSMLSRRELESLLGTKLTDEQWEENCKIMSRISDRIWEEDHPLDD